MPKNKILTCLVLAVALSCLGSPKQANAEEISLSINPAILEVMIKPGRSITQVYKLTNHGTTDLIIGTSIVPFEPEGEDGGIRLLPDQSQTNNPEQVFSFQNADLSLGEKFHLQAGKTREVVLKIKLPESSREDDYYFTLLFETYPPETDQPASSSKAIIGSHILLTITQNGEPIKKATIEEFGLRNPLISFGQIYFVDSFSPMGFVVRLKNTGHSVFKPNGKITTKGWSNPPALDLTPENVLNDSIRAIRCKKENGDEIGPCQIENRFLIGKYQSKLSFTLDSDKEEYSRNLTFFAFPLKLGFGLIIAVVILLSIKKRVSKND